jgi:hypothetical protein
MPELQAAVCDVKGALAGLGGGEHVRFHRGRAMLVPAVASLQDGRVHPIGCARRVLHFSVF